MIFSWAEAKVKNVSNKVRKEGDIFVVFLQWLKDIYYEICNNLDFILLIFTNLKKNKLCLCHLNLHITYYIKSKLSGNYKQFNFRFQVVIQMWVKFSFSTYTTFFLGRLLIWTLVKFLVVKYQKSALLLDFKIEIWA